MSQNFKLLADAITPFYDINFSPYTARVQTESGDKLKVYITWEFNGYIRWSYGSHCNFQAHSQNCKKRQLVSSRLAVRQYAKTLLPLDGFSWNLIFEYFYIFRKSFEKIQVLLEFAKNKDHFTWRPIYVCDHISPSSS